VAGVAEIYPRLLAWLAEGRASWHWNLFGGWIAVLRLIPGLRWILWHFLLEPVARRAPWRFELQEAILQDKRYNYNVKHRDKSSTTLIIRETPGLSAVTDVATITQTATCNKVREKIEKMSSGCIGVSGFRGSGKSALIRDFCRKRYGTPTWSESNLPCLPGLRLAVHAPVQYDAREFLIHQYTSFAHHIVVPLLLPRSIRPAALLRGLTGAALLILAGGLFWRAAVGSWPVPSWSSQTWVLDLSDGSAGPHRRADLPECVAGYAACPPVSSWCRGRCAGRRSRLR
jgi:hypothetical protein